MNRYEQYKNYIDSDEWRQLRNRKIAAVGRSCQLCTSAHAIHVHHIRYKNLTDVDLIDLAVLCEKCHNHFHKACRKLKRNPEDQELPQIARTMQDFPLKKKVLSDKHLDDYWFKIHVRRFKGSKRTIADLDELLKAMEDFLKQFVK